MMKFAVQKIDLAKAFRSAEAVSGVLAMDSETQGLGYIYDEKKVAIITSSDGVIRLSIDQLDNIISELLWVKELSRCV